MSRRKHYNVDQIRKLYVTATSNKVSDAKRKAAKSKLLEIAEEQRVEANERLVDLRASDYAYGQAYDVAQNYIEQHYGDRALSFHKQRKLGDVYSQAMQIASFLNSKQSTVSGQKAIEQQRFKKFREMSPKLRTMKTKDLREFLKFLGNTSAGDYLNFYDDSGDEREMIAELWDDENKADKLNALLAEYEEYMSDIKNGVEPKDARGLSASELREQLYALYTSEEKRKR
jgi:hypothetical protein